VKRALSSERILKQPRRLLVTGFMLLAFLLQSYVTQTHIHFDTASAIAKTVTADGAPAKKNSPADDNPDNCPLCQLLYGGQYVAPDALVFFLPMATVSTIEFALGVTPHYDAVSHSWRGRAPPRL
jgi:hypothetical protein